MLDFPDRAFGALSPADYETLGFAAGLEVHQQLETRSKLFCRCPAGRYVTRVDGEVLRHMRPTLSELGEYDGTALMEFKTKKEIVYLLERGSVCTYEMDDTPPFEMDQEAVRIAIEMALLLRLNLVSELHVMRKQYLDGSIPTGFQRSAMVGLAGAIPFRVSELGVDRELRIRQLSLEEDSCRELSDIGHRITFRTDRLGMPLTETVTEPDLKNPLELQAAARLLAQVARATGKVRRGPGAARQDVNVSVAGGRRVEIKGVHHHRGLPRLVHVEAYRQLNLLRVRAMLLGRGVEAQSLAIPGDGPPWELSGLVRDIGTAMRGTHAGFAAEALATGERVVAVRLPGFAGTLSHRTQPGLTFAHELAERVRVIACPVRRPFLAYSDGPADGRTGGRNDRRTGGPADRRTDETASPRPALALGGTISFELSDSEWRTARRLVGADPDDAVVLVWALEADAATAAREILIRAAEALKGVPAETRQAFADGTTGFERILPGPDRMYPDTDTPPLPIPDGVVTEIRGAMPETPWLRIERYQRLGLSHRVAERLAGAPWADAFDGAGVPRGDFARRLATALATRLPYHRRRGRNPWMPSPNGLKALAGAVERGEVRPEALPRLVDALITEPDLSVSAIVRRFARRPEHDAAMEGRLAETVRRAAALDGRAPNAVVRWAMGEVMREFLGQADPVEVRRRLTELLEGRGGGTEDGRTERRKDGKTEGRKDGKTEGRKGGKTEGRKGGKTRRRGARDRKVPKRPKPRS
jgi:glutamyl-tRNA(Gln) amidotransferase subunit E